MEEEKQKRSWKAEGRSRGGGEKELGAAGDGFWKEFLNKGSVAGRQLWG